MTTNPSDVTDPKNLSREDIAQLPKVVLHDHLDGGLRAATIVELAEAAGYGKLPTTDPEELEHWFVAAANSGSLPKYLETFDHTTAVMQTAEAITRVTAEAVVDLAADNVVYAELRFAPEQHQSQGLSLQDIVDAAVAGCQQGEAQAAQQGKQITARLILCAMRHTDRSVEIAQLTIDNHTPDGYVAGFDIAGPEDGFPPSRHHEAFDMLRRNHVPFTIHAGEAAGRDSLESAVYEGAQRIGHGARVYEDFSADLDGIQAGRLSSYIRDRRTPLELCPTSNVHTGVVDDLADHPFALLDTMHFAVTVNTDNRLVSGTTMTQEMAVLVEQFNYDLDGLFNVTQNAIEQAFIPQDLREEILNDQIIPGFEKVAGIESDEPEPEATQGRLTQEELDAIDPALLEELGIDPKDFL